MTPLAEMVKARADAVAARDALNVFLDELDSAIEFIRMAEKLGLVGA